MNDEDGPLPGCHGLFHECIKHLLGSGGAESMQVQMRLNREVAAMQPAGNPRGRGASDTFHILRRIRHAEPPAAIY